jgi:hypothetical protein
MDFGAALVALKDGKAVCREGWNGKGMHLAYISPTGWALHGYFPSAVGVTYAPWICMKTVDNKIVPWLASQTDILADDWQIAFPKTD